MSNLTEFVITSDASGQLWNSCVWDPRAGTSLMVYKGGGASAPRSLCLLGNDYLLSAESVKPLLHVWPLNSQEAVHQGLRTVCPGRVGAMAVTLDGEYCVAGIAEKLHVWQMASGRLLAVAARHFQKVTCVRFTDDGSHFVSGGEDGMVMVWSLPGVVCLVAGDAGDPRHVFSDHSLPVTDLHVGHGGLRARLVSVSSDRTCKAYDLASGSLLLSVIFNASLTSVTTGRTERDVFVGTVDGNIHQFDLRDPPRMREYHVEAMDKKALTFAGHTKAVTCLSTSLDGLTLLSGSNDEKVMIWHISSRQCVRVLAHKGPITNAFFAVAPKQVFSSDLKPTIRLHSFQRGMDQDEANCAISVMTTENLHVSEEQLSHETIPMFNSTGNANDVNLQQERDLYQKVNYDLYKFAIEKILKPIRNGDKNEDDAIEQQDNIAVSANGIEVGTYARAPAFLEQKSAKKQRVGGSKKKHKTQK